MPFTWSKLSKIFTFFVILLFTLDVQAFAEEIPEDALMIDYANCMTGCKDFEGQFGCEVLCGCTVERFKTALNEETYALLKDQIAKNEVSEENRDFLDETAFLCVAEMDELKAEYGLEAPPEGDLVLPPPEDDDGGR